MLSKKEIALLYHEDMVHFDPYIKQISVHRTYFQKKVQAIQHELRKFQISNLTFKIKLLDIGCAMGILLEEAGKKGIDAYGVDISRDAVRYCRKKGLKVSEKFPRKSFDIITAFEVLEHEREPRAFMGRIHKLLKKGGFVVLTTPNHSSLWQKIMGRAWVGYKHPEHVTFWDAKSLHELMCHTGFKKIVIAHDEPRPFPLSFVFTRSADYFPCLRRQAWLRWFLMPVGKFFDRFGIINPVNPWDDLIVYGRK